jgi:hypothetical protein
VGLIIDDRAGGDEVEPVYRRDIMDVMSAKNVA